MSLLDAVIAVADTLAIDINVSNLCVIAIEDTSDLLESGATAGKVSLDSYRRGQKVTYRVST